MCVHHAIWLHYEQPSPIKQTRFNACHMLCRDLNVIGGRAFHADLPEYVRDQRAFWLDCDKPVVNKSNSFHGTHVAGIIGAKNDGRGPYGVLPGEISCCVAKKAAVETWTAASALLVPSARHMTSHPSPYFISTSRCQDLCGQRFQRGEQ